MLMKIATGNVVKGATIIDNPEFKEGTEVFILTREREEEVRLSPEELAELGAGIAEADIYHRMEFSSFPALSFPGTIRRRGGIEP